MLIISNSEAIQLKWDGSWSPSVCVCWVTKLYLTLCGLHEPQSARLLCPWDFPGKNTGVGCQCLLQGIFPTQDWTHISCIGRWILYHTPPGKPHRVFLLFSHSVMPDSLQPHGLQHARLPCSKPSPGVCSNSCSLSWWCHPTISSCHPLLLLPSIFRRITAFPNESALYIRWSKCWSFSFSISIIPSNEYSGLISFRTDWFDLCAVQGTLKSLQHHSLKASIL